MRFFKKGCFGFCGFPRIGRVISFRNHTPRVAADQHHDPSVAVSDPSIPVKRDDASVPVKHTSPNEPFQLQDVAVSFQHSVPDHSLAADSVEGHSLAADPFGGHSLAADPVGGHSLAADPVGGHSLAADPVGGHSLAADPVRSHSLAADSVGAHSLAAVPVGGHSLAAVPVRSNNLAGDSVRGQTPSVPVRLPSPAASFRRFRRFSPANSIPSVGNLATSPVPSAGSASPVSSSGSVPSISTSGSAAPIPPARVAAPIPPAPVVAPIPPAPVAAPIPPAPVAAPNPPAPVAPLVRLGLFPRNHWDDVDLGSAINLAYYQVHRLMDRGSEHMPDGVVGCVVNFIEELLRTRARVAHIYGAGTATNATPGSRDQILIGAITFPRGARISVGGGGRIYFRNLGMFEVEIECLVAIPIGGAAVFYENEADINTHFPYYEDEFEV